MHDILKRFSQESTWRGIVTVMTAVGISIRPELAESIIAAGLAVVGLINIIKQD